MTSASMVEGDEKVGKKRDPAKRGTSVKLPTYLVDQLRQLASLEKRDMQEIMVSILAPKVAEMRQEALRRELEGLPQVKRRRRPAGGGEGGATGQGGSEPAGGSPAEAEGGGGRP